MSLAELITYSLVCTISKSTIHRINFQLKFQNLIQKCIYVLINLLETKTLNVYKQYLCLVLLLMILPFRLPVCHEICAFRSGKLFYFTLISSPIIRYRSKKFQFIILGNVEVWILKF